MVEERRVYMKKKSIMWISSIIFLIFFVSFNSLALYFLATYKGKIAFLMLMIGLGCGIISFFIQLYSFVANKKK